MILPNIPCVIALFGAEDTGKSYTLVELIDCFLFDTQNKRKQNGIVWLYENNNFKQIKNQDELLKKRGNKNSDCLVYIELPTNVVVGINTGSEDNGNANVVNDRYNFICKKTKCDIFITAAKTNGNAYDNAKEIADNFVNKGNCFFLPIKKDKWSDNTQNGLVQFLLDVIV